MGVIKFITKYQAIIWIGIICVLWSILNSQSFTISDELGKEREELIESLRSDNKSLQIQRDSLAIELREKLIKIDGLEDQVVVNQKKIYIYQGQIKDLEELNLRHLTDDSLANLMIETYEQETHE